MSTSRAKLQQSYTDRKVKFQTQAKLTSTDINVKFTIQTRNNIYRYKGKVLNPNRFPNQTEANVLTVVINR